MLFNWLNEYAIVTTKSDLSSKKIEIIRISAAHNSFILL